MKPLNEMHIAMASDHAGYALKQTVRAYLEAQGATTHDYGCYNTDSCDYPDFAHPLAEAVEKGEFDFGIVICSLYVSYCLYYSIRPQINQVIAGNALQIG